jgi:double-strand break repair protein MRE11
MALFLPLMCTLYCTRVCPTHRHAGLLEICEKRFRMKALPLKTVRPFVMKDIVLDEEESIGDKMDREAITALLVEAVEDLLRQVQEEYANVASPKHPKEPLVRLRVDYSGGFATPHPQRFGQRFVGVVANPNEILLLHRRRELKASSGVTHPPVCLGCFRVLTLPV